MAFPILFVSLIFLPYGFYWGANADPFMFGLVTIVILIMSSNYFLYIKDEKFHRILFSMPISTKDIIKTVYVSGFIAFLYLYFVAMLLSYYLTVNYGDSELMAYTMTSFNTILVILGIHIRYQLKKDMESNWWLDFLIIMGVIILYGIPSILFAIKLSEETLPLNFFVRYLMIFAISMFVYWRMYRKSVNTITAFYVEVEEKQKNGEHRSIHS